MHAVGHYSVKSVLARRTVRSFWMSATLSWQTSCRFAMPFSARLIRNRLLTSCIQLSVPTLNYRHPIRLKLQTVGGSGCSRNSGRHIHTRSSVAGLPSLPDAPLKALFWYGCETCCRVALSFLHGRKTTTFWYPSWGSGRVRNCTKRDDGVASRDTTKLAGSFPKKELRSDTWKWRRMQRTILVS